MLGKRDLALGILVQMSWGLHTPLIKMALLELSPFVLLTLRFFLTALFFLPFIKKPSAEEFKNLLRIGVVMFGLGFAFIFLALRRMDASTYVVLFQMQIPLGVMAGALFFHEKVSRRTWLGIALAFLGVVFMFGEPKVNQDLLSVLLVFLACLNGAVNGVLLKKLKDVHLPTFISLTALAAAFVHMLCAVLFERDEIGRIHTAEWGLVSVVLLYQALAMSFAMMIWQRVLSRNDLSKANPLNLLFPFFSVLFSIWLLDERLTVPVLIGGACVLFGVGLVTVKPFHGRKTKKIFQSPVS